MDDFYFGSSSERRGLSKKGLIRKIGIGVYTSILDDEKLKEALQYNWALIVCHAFPNAVVTYRTAIEFRPSPNGYIFLASSKNKESNIGGITFKEIRSENIKSVTDTTGMMGAKVACPERAFLELYRLSRKAPSDDRYLDIGILEKRLEEILKDSGEDRLNAFRDKVKSISEELSLAESFKRLNSTIKGMLGSGSLEGQSTLVKNRGSKNSVDKEREILFEKLASDLSTQSPPDILETTNDHLHVTNKAFFESYFSNYIEGTEFLIEEAEDIVFHKNNSLDRPEDSHDISGTYNIVSDENFMRKPYSSCENFLDDLRYINEKIIPLRVDKNPGEWKSKSNKAGNSVFVNPSDVVGTLIKGYDIAQRLENAFLRGIFLAFVVSEVHPFTDGNGRTCRVILNRELKKSNFSTIIVPTVYRDDYVGALRQITRRGLSDGYYRMFLRAWKFSNLNFTNYQDIKSEIKSRNWFLEPSEGKIIEN